MAVSVSAQTFVFLFSCVLGAGLGLLYDIFRIIRLAAPCGKVAVFFQDILFLLACTAATFLFLLRESAGEVRIFILVGEILGAVLYYLTFGTLIMKLSRLLIDSVKRFKAFLIRLLLPPMRRTSAKINRGFDVKSAKAKKMLIKENKLLQIRLKLIQRVMYNQLHVKKSHDKAEKSK